MIRIEAVWLVTAPLDMCCGTDTALARVVKVFGEARRHHAYLFANARAKHAAKMARQFAHHFKLLSKFQLKLKSDPFFVYFCPGLRSASVERLLLRAVHNATHARITLVDRVLVLPTVARLLRGNLQRTAFVFKRPVHHSLRRVKSSSAVHGHTAFFGSRSTAFNARHCCLVSCLQSRFDRSLIF